ncbi:MAG: hypothetical protein KDK37_14640 [Leptospiraceae bacterium]|nr:hypothetical protein [Leptospiraceae bacterium]
MRTAVFTLVAILFGTVAFLFFGYVVESISPGALFSTGAADSGSLSRLTVFALFIIALSYSCSDAIVSGLMGHRRPRNPPEREQTVERKRHRTHRRRRPQ